MSIHKCPSHRYSTCLIQPPHPKTSNLSFHIPEELVRPDSIVYKSEYIITSLVFSKMNEMGHCIKYVH